MNIAEFRMAFVKQMRERGYRQTWAGNPAKSTLLQGYLYYDDPIWYEKGLWFVTITQKTKITAQVITRDAKETMTVGLDEAGIHIVCDLVIKQHKEQIASRNLL